MKLSILTWNINFMHDHWLERVESINSTLEKHINNTDIIALQEATLPFSNGIDDIYKFIKCNKINYTTGPEFFFEKDFIYKKIRDVCPKYEKIIKNIFEYFMDKFLFFCGYIFSHYGESIKKLYFSHPYISIFIMLLCPFIVVGSWFFIGMVTIVNQNIKTTVRSKYVGRALQISEFVLNEREIIFINTHLSPGQSESSKKKRKREIKKIYKIVKEKEISILAGDFNETPNGFVYKFLKAKGFTSVCHSKKGFELNTFPSKYPIKCIDYIWIKGDLVDIQQVSHFGNERDTDHKGIKVVLNIKKIEKVEKVEKI